MIAWFSHPDLFLEMKKSIADVVSICAKDDVEIITPNMHNIHVSGHAYRGDIELFQIVSNQNFTCPFMGHLHN